VYGTIAIFHNFCCLNRYQNMHFLQEKVFLWVSHDFLSIYCNGSHRDVRRQSFGLGSEATQNTNLKSTNLSPSDSRRPLNHFFASTRDAISLVSLCLFLLARAFSPCNENRALVSARCRCARWSFKLGPFTLSALENFQTCLRPGM
jgi:hypothetical protein